VGGVTMWTQWGLRPSRSDDQSREPRDRNYPIRAVSIEIEPGSMASGRKLMASPFVHISAVERAGLSGLNEGQGVEYEEAANKR
jgi:hypothetical protein